MEFIVLLLYILSTLTTLVLAVQTAFDPTSWFNLSIILATIGLALLNYKIRLSEIYLCDDKRSAFRDKLIWATFIPTILYAVFFINYTTGNWKYINNKAVTYEVGFELNNEKVVDIKEYLRKEGWSYDETYAEFETSDSREEYARIISKYEIYWSYNMHAWVVYTGAKPKREHEAFHDIIGRYGFFECKDME